MRIDLTKYHYFKLCIPFLFIIKILDNHQDNFHKEIEETGQFAINNALQKPDGKRKQEKVEPLLYLLKFQCKK